MVNRAVHIYILKKTLLILSSENKRYFKKNLFINYLEHTEHLSKLDLQCEFGDDRHAPLLEARWKPSMARIILSVQCDEIGHT